MPVAKLEKFKSKLDGTTASFVEVNGYFKYSNSKYSYYIQDQLLYIGEFGADRNAIGAFYKPLKLENISKLKDLEIYDYDKILLITNSKKTSIIDLEKYVSALGFCESSSLFQKSKTNKTYVVIKVAGSSRWPPGDTYCGVGYEVNLVWIELDQNLHSTKVQSVLIKSCFKDVYNQETLQGNQLKANGIFYQNRDTNTSTDTNDSNSEKTLIYDNEKPELGFVEIA